MDVTTNHIPLGGFTWNVLVCPLFPVVNGAAQHVGLTENEKLVACNDACKWLYFARRIIIDIIIHVHAHTILL